MEYVGDPFEKLLGFLIAAVILAFYIGVVNLLLMFLSFSLFQDNFAAYALSLLGVVPLWFFAQYRARRYVLARTRWRGLRFGLEPGAWGYAWRAMAHWTVTLLSLGLLWPRMTFWLEKYKTDRTHYGAGRLHQGGRWTMLYASTKPIVVAALIGIGATTAIATDNVPLGVALAILAALAGLYGIVYYRVDTLRRLTNTKTLDETGLSLTPSAFRVLAINVLGRLLAGIAILVPASVLGVLLLLVQSAETLAELGLDELAGPFSEINRWVLVGMSVMLYFTIFLLWSALSHAFVTMPVLRHYARNLTVENPVALDAIGQRPRDSFDDAEGFAEALDVGASL